MYTENLQSPRNNILAMPGIQAPNHLLLLCVQCVNVDVKVVGLIPMLTEVMPCHCPHGICAKIFFS